MSYAFGDAARDLNCDLNSTFFTWLRGNDPSFVADFVDAHRERSSGGIGGKDPRGPFAVRMQPMKVRLFVALDISGQRSADLNQLFTCLAVPLARESMPSGIDPDRFSEEEWYYHQKYAATLIPWIAEYKAWMAAAQKPRSPQTTVTARPSSLRPDIVRVKTAPPHSGSHAPPPKQPTPPLRDVVEASTGTWLVVSALAVAAGGGYWYWSRHR